MKQFNLDNKIYDEDTDYDDFDMVEYIRLNKVCGLCSECNQPNTGDQWCRSCNASRLKADFPNWTSRKTEIDQFIQKFN